MFLSFDTLVLIFGIGFLIGAIFIYIFLKVKYFEKKVEWILFIVSVLGFLFSVLVMIGFIDTESQLAKDCHIRADSVGEHGFVKDFGISLLSIDDAGVPMVQISTDDLNERYPCFPGKSIHHSDFIIFCKSYLKDNLKVAGVLVNIYYRYDNRFFKILNYIFTVLSFLGLVFTLRSILSKKNTTTNNSNDSLSVEPSNLRNTPIKRIITNVCGIAVRWIIKKKYKNNQGN